MLLEGLVGLLLRGKLYQIDNLCCARGPQSTHTVVKLGEAGGNSPDGELRLSLSPNKTQALSAQNSGILRATALRSKLRELEAVARSAWR